MDENELPEVIEQLAARMFIEIRKLRSELTTTWLRIGRTTDEHLEFLQHLDDVVIDARTLLTAYAHAFQEPRPNIAKLARAQGITPAGLRRRYTQTTVDTIQALLDGTAKLDDLTTTFPSLGPGRLFGLLPTLDAELRESGYSPSVRENPMDPESHWPFFADILPQLGTELPAPRHEIEHAHKRSSDAASLLGLVVQTLGDALVTAEGPRGWTMDQLVRYEWGGSLQISQILAILLPYYGDFPHDTDAMISGIPALRLNSHTEREATLTWFGPSEVQLQLTRRPPTPWLIL